jgi:hypothetical protein
MSQLDAAARMLAQLLLYEQVPTNNSTKPSVVRINAQSRVELVT